MGKATDLKFSMQIEQTKKRKSRSIGACPALHDLFFKFWDTLHISGMGIARRFKFGVRIDRQACKAKNAKVGQKVRGLLLVT